MLSDEEEADSDADLRCVPCPKMRHLCVQSLSGDYRSVLSQGDALMDDRDQQDNHLCITVRRSCITIDKSYYVEERMCWKRGESR